MAEVSKEEDGLARGEYGFDTGEGDEDAGVGGAG